MISEKRLDHEMEGPHIRLGRNGQRYRESADVVHAILAHHGDVEANTVEAILVQAADAISLQDLELEEKL